MVKDRHVIEALGKTEVVIENGKVVSIGEPNIDFCPIFKKIENIDQFDKEFIKNNIERRIREFGMCTPERLLNLPDMMSFGISEILKTNVELGVIDCVVGVCEGAGTILMTDPNLIQGVGGRVSALISTTPIPEVIENIGYENVINPETAELDPISGLELAIKRGYKNIAITILPSPLIKEIRNYNIPEDVNVYIFVAHTSGISMEDVKEVFENADVVTACASKNVRDYADEVKPYYSGSKVTIFATSDMGRVFLDNRLKYINKPLCNNKDYPLNRENIPRPLF
ncbi:hypothetical protein BGI41_06525 [Methanobrevibacter sp. 87.7]|uniref:methanogenesis marker 8 protein n=1 Tax=Methanobrevibacter sp. 87.7 TaxID=387957 RepID=UPI000B50D123|nr:methanogenesis marker 8 protein [Methanobrevibacter sp. 87.7]OWT32663.1 hypothetical protein BGI41_06525 [Methanobrevibacter sp. 87.7]